MIVSKRFSFDAAHYLPSYEGKCKNMHGHHWVAEVGVEGDVKANGMVVDFTLLGKFLKLVEDTFDHGVINDIVENPTAENICLWIKDKLLDWKEDGHISFLDLNRLSLAWVRVWETDTSMAESSGEVRVGGI